MLHLCVCVCVCVRARVNKDTCATCYTVLMDYALVVVIIYFRQQGEDTFLWAERIEYPLKG